MSDKVITLGQKRVQRSFSSSANPIIEEIKESYALLIDKIEGLKNQSNGREISIAQTELETSCMYAVKSLFV